MELENLSRPNVAKAAVTSRARTSDTTTQSKPIKIDSVLLEIDIWLGYFGPNRMVV